MVVNNIPIGIEYGWLSLCKLFDMKLKLCRDVHSNLYVFH
jgi:hypothetical protein